MPIIDEESESIAADSLMTNKEMLNLVYGDSGIDRETDNDLSRKLQPDTTPYISQQEAEMICNTTTDHGKINHGNSPNSSSSNDQSTLLSKVYKSFIRHTSVTNESDFNSESNETVETFLSSTIEGNDSINHSLSYFSNTSISTTAEEDVFYDQNSALNTNQTLLSSVESNTPSNAEDGSYIDHCVSSLNSNNKHSTVIDTTTTPESGIYVDHCAAKKTITCPSYASTAAATIEDGNHINCYDSSNAGHPFPYNDTTVTGSYIDRYAASNVSQPLSHPTYNDTTETGDYIDHYATSNASQPLFNSVDTTSPTAVDGSYVDYYMVSTNDDKKSSVKPSCKEEILSSALSFAVDDSINGLYLPYTIAVEQSNTDKTSQYSAGNKALITSTTTQSKRKPANLFFLSNGNMFPCNPLNEECSTLNVGEYISHGNLPSLGIINNNCKLQQTGDNRCVFPSYYTSSHPTVKSNHFDYDIVMKQNGASESGSVQQVNPHMQQDTNVQFIHIVNAAPAHTSSVYITESDL